MTKPLVTFAAISYQERDEIYMFIGMLRCIKNPNWKAMIYHDGPNNWMKEIVEQFNDSRIQYIENEKNSGSWGAYNRKRIIELTDTEFIIQTTVQEYYTVNVVDVIEENKYNDLIYWPCVHHSFDYNILNAEPERGRIDWSNFAIKTQIAKKVGINFPDAYMADGLFVEDCMKSGFVKRKIKINKILNIKN
jgi:hypothetical protein